MTDVLELEPSTDGTEPELHRGGAPDLSQGSGAECPECDWSANPAWPVSIQRAHLGRHRRRAHGVAPPAKARRKVRVPKVTEPKAPRSGRKSAAKLLSWAWEGLGTMLPGRVGGVLAWEAPAAGPILDRALAGSFVDRWLLQRAAQIEDRYEPVVMLLVPAMAAMAADLGQPVPPFMEPLVRQAYLSIIGDRLRYEASMRHQMADLAQKAREAGVSEDLGEDYEIFKRSLGLVPQEGPNEAA